VPARIIRTIIVLGVLAITGIVFIQYYWVSQTLDLREQEFQESVTIALRKVAEQISTYNKTELPKTNLVHRRYSNYYYVNINSIIDANILEDLLFQEFEKRSLNTVFEYAVYDCQNDSLVYGNHCNISEESQSFVRTENLPKFEDLVYYFVVKFPTKGSYILSTMRQSIAFSAIALLAVVFFGYAMWVILRQKQQTELQKDFINNMTHEFKTPISSIKIASDYMISNSVIKESERLSKYADIIKQQNNRLNDQVEKVLNIARLEKDHFELKKQSINLNKTLEEIVLNEQIKYNEKQGQINIEKSKENVFILADRLHFINVISTLLDNSNKYCEKSPIVNIEIRKLSDYKCQLIIQDNGFGIDKDSQKKIFEKFYRVPTGDVHNVKGFGLGLYYVKNICDSHRWDLELKSEVNKGTTFYITFKTAKQNGDN